MKKLLCVMLAVIMTAAMVTGCGSSETKETGADSGETVNVGVIQYMQHASLDEAYQGFVDGLKEAGYVEGENLKINYQNASGEVSNCQQICELFANSDTDLVLAIATPAAQSAANVFQETEVPVFFTAVTDAVGAGLVDSNEAPGKNVTGTLDMPVIADQIAVIKDVLPDAQKLAILYTSSEANSEIQAEEAKAAAEALGMEVIVQTSSSSNDIPQVIASVVGSADAIYIPSDNAFASAMATVNSTAVENQIPVFCAVEAMIAEGGIATTAIDYYELGKQTAAMAVRALNGEKASEIPVETQKECALVVNETFAASVGVEIPAEVVEKATTKY
ncbi:MAG: ABC transporter substrate-binding protein [Lachnospiraceae bacterium]|nr:ABC transporter substrate-binding protein [Lachnospiraceae bacterium]